MILAHVFSEHTCEVTVSPRVSRRKQEDSPGRIALRVRSEAHPRQRDLAANIVLAHEKVADADTGAVFDYQIDGSVLRRHAAHFRDLRKRLARERLQLGVLE